MTGRVQGVSFRWHAQQEARRNGLVGWVRNLPDGRVEALLQGDDAGVEAVLAWIRAGGPPAARVDDVAVSPRELDAALAGFEVRR